MSYFALPITFAYLEILNFALTQLSANLFGPVLCAFAAGFVFDLALMIAKRNKWILFALCEIVTIFFCIEYFTNDAYSVYMSPAAIVSGAGGVATEFSDSVISIIKGGVGQIFLFHIPGILIFLFNIKSDIFKVKRSGPAIGLAMLAAVFCQSMGCEALINYNEAVYSYLYTYDSAVKNLGVCTAVRLDAAYAISGVPAAPAVEAEPEVLDETDGLNVWDINYKQIAALADEDYTELLMYIANRTPSEKNEYTGLFAGKNLVLIAAESLSKETIREDINPCLYRMASNGIVVEDYYQPFWGGSTTSGEASILLGRVPTESTDSMLGIVGKDNSYLLAESLEALGYSSTAVHPGQYDYYDRYITHMDYGFDEFYARESNLDIPYTWPGDDLAAIKATLGSFASGQPFFMYFMSYSGHGLYNYHGNQMSINNKAFIDSLELGGSEMVQAYHAANHQLDLALQYLCDELEARGELDNTVFVISPDHYPYALQKGDAWKNEEDYLSELYGYSYSTEPERDHAPLIIWSPCLEEMDPIVVSNPCCSIDILPTIYNLFGVDFDSRMFVGRDILSDSEHMAVWITGSFKVREGFYNASRNQFIPSGDGVTLSEDELNAKKLEVAKMIDFSRRLYKLDLIKYIKENE